MISVFCVTSFKYDMIYDKFCFSISIVIITCKKLTDPVNGIVEQLSNLAGSLATYTCRDGFSLVGVDTRICQSDGLWSDEEPYCNCKDDLL